MSYLLFLAVFLLPPLVAILLLERGHLPRGLRWQLPLLAGVAILYTAPWDHELIAQRVWTYPADRVLGATLLSVPIEEYGFYVLQTFVVGLLAAAVWRRLSGRVGA